MKANLQLVGCVRETVDLDRLARMKPDELRRVHRNLFGCDVPFGNSEQARRRIAFRVQTEREGALPESARQHALAIAREAALRIRKHPGTCKQHLMEHAGIAQIISGHDRRLPMPGSVIVKEYRGRNLEVHVLDSGFEYDGRRFTSLSAVANEITGTKWNGLAFFGLAKERLHGR